MSNLTNIFLDGVLVDVNVSFWSGSRILSPEDLGLKPEDIADAYKLGKKFLIPSEVIKGFRRIESMARRTVDENSFRFPIGNARFVPRKKFSKVLNKLNELRDKYNDMVYKLVENYDEYRKEMLPVYQEAAELAYGKQSPKQTEFGPDYDIEAEKNHFINNFLMRINAFYPPAETLRSKFNLDWDVFEIAIPRLEKGSAEQIALDQDKREAALSAYQTQVHQKIGSFVEDVVKVLRQETIDICSKISQNIKQGKVVKGKTLSSLKNFVEKFQDLNFVGDEDVEYRLEALKKEFLDIYPTNRIGEEVELTTELQRRLGELVEAASNMTDINTITGQYKRKVQWQEESVNA